MVSTPEKAKLIWNCRRGMLELDLILSRFIPHLDALSNAQLVTFSALLHSSDPVLYSWLIGQDQPADKELAAIVALIRFHNNPSSIQ